MISTGNRIQKMSNNTHYDFKSLNKDKVWFTSDLHFGHKNIIKYCNRPFNDVDEMDLVLINNWNNVVNHDDIIFCLGDFSLTSTNNTINILQKLNGNKVLIRGNHEKSVLSTEKCRSFFNGGIYDLLEVRVIDEEVVYGFQDLILCHYPMLTWDKSHRGSWQLFGHVHGTLDDNPSLSPNQLDVGVDSHYFNPISYQTVKELLTIKNLR